jgi:hypothetical protein
MGVDTADYDRSGNTSLLISNFSNQMLSLYHNEGKGLFVDEAPRSEVGRASLLTLGFGCFFFDCDLDGWTDILVANGHIDPDIQKVQVNGKFAEPPHLFRNLGKGKFAEVTKSAGPEFAATRVGRSAAYADVFNDGRLDVLLSTNGGAVHLFRNVAAGTSKEKPQSQHTIQIDWNEIESRRNWRCAASDFLGRNANANIEERIELPGSE